MGIHVLPPTAFPVEKISTTLSGETPICPVLPCPRELRDGYVDEMKSATY
ncbi:MULTISPECIES: hypothetical protein [unclassified Nocardia]|nr:MULTISPECIES: hypothetical protein [unclassified Nocardia]